MLITSQQSSLYWTGVCSVDLILDSILGSLQRSPMAIKLVCNVVCLDSYLAISGCASAVEMLSGLSCAELFFKVSL